MHKGTQAKKQRRPLYELRQMRDQRGWTRQYVAESIGLPDEDTLGRWERGVTFPSPLYRQKLCELFELSAMELGLIPPEEGKKDEECVSDTEPSLPALPSSLKSLPVAPVTSPSRGRRRFSRREVALGLLSLTLTSSAAFYLATTISSLRQNRSSITNLTLNISASHQLSSFSLAAVSRDNKSMDVFTLGQEMQGTHNQQIYNLHYDGHAWELWQRDQNPATTTFTSISALTKSPTQTEIFAVAQDQAVWQIQWDKHGTVSKTRLGGQVISPVTAIMMGPGLVDLFIVGSDYQVWQNSQRNQQWSGWNPLGGQAIMGNSVSALSAITTGLNSMSLFLVGSDYQVWQNSWQNTQWSGWRQCGGQVSEIVAVATALGEIELFVVGSDFEVWSQSGNGTQWSGWKPMQGIEVLHRPDFSASHRLAAVSDEKGDLDVFAVGIGGQIWHQSRRGKLWSGWEPLGGSMYEILALKRDGEQIDLLAIGLDFCLYHQIWRDSDQQKSSSRVWQPLYS